MKFEDSNADFQIDLRDTVGDLSGKWPGRKPNWDTWYSELGAVTYPGPAIGNTWAPSLVSEYFNYALGDFAAHEFGHILGLPDEYLPNASPCKNLPIVGQLGVMGCWMVMQNGTIDFGPVQDRYFYDILSDISNIVGHPVAGFAPSVPFEHTGQTYGPFGLDYLTTDGVIPEPPINALLLLGLGSLVFALRRKQLC